MATLNARKLQSSSNLPLTLANMPSPNPVGTIQRGMLDRITIRIDTAKEVMHEEDQEVRREGFTSDASQKDR